MMRKWRAVSVELTNDTRLLTVCVTVDSQCRFGQGFGVVRIPASDILAGISRQKRERCAEVSRKKREKLLAAVEHRIHAQDCFGNHGHDQDALLIMR